MSKFKVGQWVVGINKDLDNYNKVNQIICVVDMTVKLDNEKWYHENFLELFSKEEETKSSCEDTTINNGGSTDYYKLPLNAKDLQDLIEHKDMNFSLGNIFKACYRLGNCSHSEALRDLNKIVWFANREIKRLKNENN